MESQLSQDREIELRDEQATHYSDDINQTRGAYWVRAQVGLVLHYLRMAPGLKVYDAGAGVGIYTFALASKYPTATIYAVDFSPNSVRVLSNEAVNRGHHNITTDVRDVIAYAPEQNSFDRALTADVLQHLPGHEARLTAVRNIHHALKPGGIFVTVNYRWGGWITPPGAKVDTNYNNTGLYRFAFTEEEGRALLEEAGFRNVRSFGIIRVPKKIRHHTAPALAVTAELCANALGLFGKNAQYVLSIGVK